MCYVIQLSREADLSRCVQLRLVWRLSRIYIDWPTYREFLNSEKNVEKILADLSQNRLIERPTYRGWLCISLGGAYTIIWLCILRCDIKDQIPAYSLTANNIDILFQFWMFQFLNCILIFSFQWISKRSETDYIILPWIGQYSLQTWGSASKLFSRECCEAK